MCSTNVKQIIVFEDFAGLYKKSDNKMKNIKEIQDEKVYRFNNSSTVVWYYRNS